MALQTYCFCFMCQAIMHNETFRVCLRRGYSCFWNSDYVFLRQSQSQLGGHGSNPAKHPAFEYKFILVCQMLSQETIARRNKNKDIKGRHSQMSL